MKYKGKKKEKKNHNRHFQQKTMNEQQRLNTWSNINTKLRGNTFKYNILLFIIRIITSASVNSGHESSTDSKCSMSLKNRTSSSKRISEASLSGVICQNRGLSWCLVGSVGQSNPATLGLETSRPHVDFYTDKAICPFIRWHINVESGVV